MVEHKHFSSIVIALEEFVTNHTNAVEPNNGSSCKPLLSEVNNILLSGDSSIRSFQGLRSCSGAIEHVVEDEGS